MKKWMIALSLVLVCVFTLTTVVSAQAEEPPPPEGFPPGWQARLAARRHPAAFAAFAQALADELGLTLEEMKERVKGGETPLQIAQSLGYSEEEYRSLLVETREGLLEEALAEGKITEERAEAIRQRWEEGIKRADLARYLRQGVRERLAEALGLSTEALQERLEHGETMLDIAQSQGYSAEDLRGLAAEAQAQVIDQAVQDGLLTEAQAQKLRETLEGKGAFFQRARRRMQHLPEKRFLYPRLAEKLGLDWDELQSRLVDGETWPEIMADLGIDREDLHAAMSELGADILQKAQESGLISPERARALQEGGVLQPFRWLHQRLKAVQMFRLRMR